MKRFVTICLVDIAMLFSLANLFAQWEPDVRLTFDDASSRIYYSNAWQIAAVGDTVHVVWRDKRDLNCEIYYKRSTDGGTTWEIDIRLTYNPETQCAPGIAVSGSYVHVVWDDLRNGSYFEIYYKRSTDGGTTWGIDTKISNGPTISHQPSIAVSGSYVHVVWKDWRNTHAEIYYNRSTDGGTTWGIDTRLTDTFVESWFPSVSVSESNIHVVWFDERDGNAEIYYKRSPDGGTTWGSDIRLTDDPANSSYSSIAVSGTSIHVIWKDDRDVNYQIYYKRSPDGGTSWGSDIRLTDDNSNSTNPSVAVSGTSIHVIWKDDRDGNYEIYYKRNPTGNPGIEEKIDLRYRTIDMRLLCYPNPFITSTTITLSIIGHRAEDTELKIYDLCVEDWSNQFHLPLTTYHSALT